MTTTGKAWRKLRDEGVEVALPSGLTAQLRGVGFAAVLKSGFVPDFLTSAVAEAVEGKPMQFPEDAEKSTEQALKKHAFIGEICKLMFVSPRIVDDPQADDEISIDDLDDVDRFAIIGMWGTPTAWLRNFRFRSEAMLQSLLDEQGFRNTTEQVPETETGAAEGTGT